MKIKELREKLINLPEDIDVVVGLNKSDVDDIVKVSKTEPAVLLLDIGIMDEVLDNNLVIYVYPSPIRLGII